MRRPYSTGKCKKSNQLCASLCLRAFVVQFIFLMSSLHSVAQRQDILLNDQWTSFLTDNTMYSPFIPTPQSAKWKKVSIPHNWDGYFGYRRLLHGNLHGSAVYKRMINIKQAKSGKRFFLFFEGVGSYATVLLNGKEVGQHSGGRTTFTIDVTKELKTDGSNNQLIVYAAHPANIQDQPWVCGGCSEERGFSEGSQPLGIFRPVHLLVTSDVRIEPFGVHAWADVQNAETSLWVKTTFKNYSSGKRDVIVTNELIDAGGKLVARFTTTRSVEAQGNNSAAVGSIGIRVNDPVLWSVENPYLYKIVTTIKENNIVIDRTETDFGFRTIKWNNPSHQFTLNDKPVFINGIAEYEHILGQSHAFSDEQIVARMNWIQAAGFNALRDGHQPHNLLYGKLCNQKGVLWWTQLSAHVWYDTKQFRDNFKTLLKEWVIERRNDPSVILWGLQNESKLPKDFAAECTALIRSLDPTASTQRLVTTCNGGEGTDWDVPQNWTGTYGGDPATYAQDIKKQILIGEYGAWRTIDLHSEGGFTQNGMVSEERMTQLMEQKLRLAESVKDSVAGQFFWLLTSHDNPGRVQGGEGLRELDRIGPVNYKGLLTPWEEPTEAFYMYRSNYADKYRNPMVYIASHTWPNRWMKPGVKDGIVVYSNCDEVELFNDMDNISLGKQKRQGMGTHFQWDKVNIQYNVLYAVGYVHGKAVAKDTITLFHLPQAPEFDKLYAKAQNLTKPRPGYSYLHRVNCGGGSIKDENGQYWWPDENNFSSWTKDFENIPRDFASQRRIFTPIKNSKDWKLFQSFRYGKDKMNFDFDVEDGDCLVELYFIEPWLGNGGVQAKGMRIFDVAINGKKVIDDLDIWSEAGTNTVLKKTFVVKGVNEKISISFPESKAGQALIAAIAIAGKTEEVNRRKATKRSSSTQMQRWLDIGDRQFSEEPVTINSLPSSLFGADWVQLSTKKETRIFTRELSADKDIYLAIDHAVTNTARAQGFENTQTSIITDANHSTTYSVYKKRFAKGETVSIAVDSSVILCLQPANNMQPAYDLKPVTQYRTNVAKSGEGVLKDSVNGRFCVLVRTGSQAIVDYPIQTGVADRYSITIKYFYDKEQAVKGKLQLIGPGNTMMQEEEVSFGFTRPGKWNQFTVNTNSQINAGNYIVRLVVEHASGLAFSSIDVQ